jgi:hypothetical protein
MAPKLRTKHYLILTLAIILFLVMIIIKPGKKFHFENESQQVVNHEIFNELLNKYVDEFGMVNYSGFQADSALLNKYLLLLMQNPPNEQKWSRDQKLAYWINAYNAFTIKLITTNYPVPSIKDIGSFIQIPFLNSPWDIAFINIGENKLTLNDIEHRILRKDFSEPRIHFAIVCASISCPKLRQEVYLAGKLELQLTEQAISFINDPSKNMISKEEAQISKIFLWFGGDFKKDGTLVDYLNQYSLEKISSNTSIGYLDYNWGINDQAVIHSHGRL